MRPRFPWALIRFNQRERRRPASRFLAPGGRSTEICVHDVCASQAASTPRDVDSSSGAPKGAAIPSKCSGATGASLNPIPDRIRSRGLVSIQIARILAQATARGWLENGVDSATAPDRLNGPGQLR